MNKLSKLIFLSLSFMMSLSFLFFVSINTLKADTNTPDVPDRLYLNPASVSVPLAQTTVITIAIGQLPNVGGVQYRIRFNPSILQVLDSEGAAGIQILTGSCPTAITAANTVNNATGEIFYAKADFAPCPADFNSAYITFQCMVDGISNVYFVVATGIDTVISDFDTSNDVTPNPVENSVITCGNPPTPNVPPVANDDSYMTDMDTPLNVVAPGVLANDWDQENDPLTAVLDTPPANALSFTFNADGSFAYTPNTGYTGSDSFIYHANDGTDNSLTATVHINVGATLWFSPGAPIVPFGTDPQPSPFIATVNAISSTVAVQARLDNLGNVGGVQIRVDFDPTILYVVDAEPAAGIQILTGSCPTAITAANTVNNTTGVIFYAKADFAPCPTDFDMALITFGCRVADGSTSMVSYRVATGVDTVISDFDTSNDVTPPTLPAFITCAGPTAVGMENSDAGLPAGYGALWIAGMVMIVVTAGLLIQRRRYQNL